MGMVIKETKQDSTTVTKETEIFISKTPEKVSIKVTKETKRKHYGYQRNRKRKALRLP